MYAHQRLAPVAHPTTLFDRLRLACLVLDLSGGGEVF